MYRQYPECPPLDRYYFEDSWVLDIAVTERSATIAVEAVLTPQHRDFGPPRPGEQYRYERIVLRFEDATRVAFEPSGAKPSVDARGDEDFGNIDSFCVGDAGAFALEGAWGALELDGATLGVDRLPQ